MSTVDFAIDSKDCKSSNNFFTAAVPDNRSLTTNAVELLEVILPQTTYIVQAGVNDSFEWKIGAGAILQYTIPPAAYSISSLLNTLATGTSLTFTYSSDTFKVTVSNAAAFQLMFGTGALSSTSSCTLLGFTKANTASATSQTGSNVTQLYQPLSLMLRIQELGSTNVISTSGPGASFRVPVATTSGNVLRLDRNQTYDQVITLPSATVIRTVNFQLLTNTGTLVNLNGANFQLVLRFISISGPVLR
jgi:hypothetical protein